MALEERDHGYDSLLELVEDLKERKVHVAIGVVGDDASDEVQEGLTMAGLAAVHEFGATIDHPGGTPYVIPPKGTIGEGVLFVKKDSEHGRRAIALGHVTKPHKIVIPERALIRKTLDEQESKINEAAVRMVTRVAEGKETVESGLGKVGEFVSSQIRRTIQRGVEPPNAPSTIRRKKSSKPLIDTGLLIRSYTYKVREGDEE